MLRKKIALVNRSYVPTREDKREDYDKENKGRKNLPKRLMPSKSFFLIKVILSIIKAA